MVRKSLRNRDAAVKVPFHFTIDPLDGAEFAARRERLDNLLRRVRERLPDPHARGKPAGRAPRSFVEHSREHLGFFSELAELAAEVLLRLALLRSLDGHGH